MISVHRYHEIWCAFRLVRIATRFSVKWIDGNSQCSSRLVELKLVAVKAKSAISLILHILRIFNYLGDKRVQVMIVC